MPQYLVTEPLKHNGQGFAPGDAVEMEAKAARDLLKLGVLVLAPKTAAQAKPEAKPKAEAKSKSAEKGGDAPSDGNDSNEGGE